MPSSQYKLKVTTIVFERNDVNYAMMVKRIGSGLNYLGSYKHSTT